MDKFRGIPAKNYRDIFSTTDKRAKQNFFVNRDKKIYIKPPSIHFLRGYKVVYRPSKYEIKNEQKIRKEKW